MTPLHLAVSLDLMLSDKLRGQFISMKTSSHTELIRNRGCICVPNTPTSCTTTTTATATYTITTSTCSATSTATATNTITSTSTLSTTSTSTYTTTATSCASACFCCDKSNGFSGGSCSPVPSASNCPASGSAYRYKYCCNGAGSCSSV